MRTPIICLTACILMLLLAAWTVRGGTYTTQTPQNIALLSDIPEPSLKEYLDTLWNKSVENMVLEERLIRAILRSRIIPGGTKPRWERCGKVISEENIIKDARSWVNVFLTHLKETEEKYHMSIPVWGAFAVMANESGFNECSLDFYSRLWASRATDKFLITETWKGKTVTRKQEQKVVADFRLTYDKETVWRIVTCDGFKTAKVEVKDSRNPGKTKWIKINGKFDGGPFQIRLSTKHLNREKFDGLMSMDTGISNGVDEMARRAIGWMYKWREPRPHPRPWKLWPGRYLSPKGEIYDRKIISVARWLGAKREEIDPKYIPR